MVYSYSARRVRADVPASIPLLQVQVDHPGLARRHRAYRRPSPPDLVMHIKVVTAAYLVRSACCSKSVGQSLGLDCQMVQVWRVRSLRTSALPNIVNRKGERRRGGGGADGSRALLLSPEHCSPVSPWQVLRASPQASAVTDPCRLRSVSDRHEVAAGTDDTWEEHYERQGSVQVHFGAPGGSHHESGVTITSSNQHTHRLHHYLLPASLSFLRNRSHYCLSVRPFTTTLGLLPFLPPTLLAC